MELNSHKHLIKKPNQTKTPKHKEDATDKHKFEW